MRRVQPPRQNGVIPKHKKGTGTELVLAMFEKYGELSYYDLWHLTGRTRNQSAVSVKYLRSVGYMFQTMRNSEGMGGSYGSLIKYVGHEVDLFDKLPKLAHN